MSRFLSASITPVRTAFLSLQTMMPCVPISSHATSLIGLSILRATRQTMSIIPCMEVLPDDHGVRPQIRYYYEQRSPWLKSSNGGYVASGTPIWVLTQEEYCRTSAASGNGCSAGSADEVVTTYDYGPDSGPNNLWLRGKTVTSEGVSLRTCYTYDVFGNQHTETTPNANLTSCP